VLAHEWQTIPERGVLRSREPFKFWWAPTIFSGTADHLRCWQSCQLRWAVNVANWWWSRSPVYHTDCRHLCTTRWAWCTACVARVCQRQWRLVKVQFGLTIGFKLASPVIWSFSISLSAAHAPSSHDLLMTCFNENNLNSK